MVLDVSFQIEIPDEVEINRSDLIEYLMACLGMSHKAIYLSNPLYEFDLMDLNPSNLKVN